MAMMTDTKMQPVLNMGGKIKTKQKVNTMPCNNVKTQTMVNISHLHYGNDVKTQVNQR